MAIKSVSVWLARGMSNIIDLEKVDVTPANCEIGKKVASTFSRASKCT